MNNPPETVGSPAAASTAPAAAAERLAAEIAEERRHRVRQTVRVWKGVGLIALIPTAFALLFVLLFIGLPEISFALKQAWLTPTPFEPSVWRAAVAEHRVEDVRLPMLRAAQESLRMGSTRADVVAAFGPDEYGSAFGMGAVAYAVASPSKCGLDHLWLVAYFDAAGRLERTDVACD